MLLLLRVKGLQLVTALLLLDISYSFLAGAVYNGSGIVVPGVQ